MSKYSEIALHAVKLVHANVVTSPVNAWAEASMLFYPNNESSQKKSCPKSSFLGLCEEGRVKNINAGSYTKSKDNKAYALEALSLLRVNPNLSEKELWNNISSKKYNQQMHVVLALFKADLIS
ncbi:hypothetical protein WNY81_08640 [Shewanella frigidimarina]|uniref:DUF6979 family protein n=1 Tax=Shewanella frigidimarina TaxID=56812 RepID=UPI0031820DCA